MGWYDNHKISELVGKTLSRVEQLSGGEILEFETVDGDKYQLYHEQDCCEAVWLEDINGDLNDLVGSPILVADEVGNLENDNPLNEHDESYTWTYYKLHTIKGGVHLRWYGVSNGYYSERVDFRKL